jgi:hypothetical protein
MAFNIYSVDEAKQSEGTWVEFEGSEFCIAYANNPTFLKEKKRLERPFKRQIERGTMNEEDQRRITCEALATGVLVDWKNVTDGKKEIPYSKEIAAEALRLNPDLLGFVVEVAADIANYKKEDVEATASKS